MNQNEVIDLAYKLFALGQTAPEVTRNIKKATGEQIPERTVYRWKYSFEDEVKNNEKFAKKYEKIKKTFEERQIEKLERICCKYETLIEKKADELAKADKLPKTTELTTAYGTLVDKMRIAKGMSTENINGTVEVKRWEDL